jgi:hypothetical protein
MAVHALAGLGRVLGSVSGQLLQGSLAAFRAAQEFLD